MKISSSVWAQNRGESMKKSKQLLSFFCMTDKGNKRVLNEDAFRVDEALGLWVVADGMGGHGSGDVASKIAVNHIVDCFKQGGSSLAHSVYSAHRAILSAAEGGCGQLGMGTTVVALQIVGSDYEVAWVGDSRAYLLDCNKIIQITKDHSLVQEMVDNGSISREEAITHPQRNVISQALGSPDMDEIQIDIVKGKISSGESLLLCTDGLTTEVSDSCIETILKQDVSTEIKVSRLIGTALDAGGNDNVTVVLLESKQKYSFLSSLRDVARRAIRKLGYICNLRVCYIK
jgi:protein phosphatase